MKFPVEGCGDLELSTQIIIHEAMQRGHAVEVLDRRDNFIRIIGNGKIEYIKQATRTSLDSYISPLIMENKTVTKLLLAEAGINTPQGDTAAGTEARKQFEVWQGTDTVIKPKSTNFGYGVHILKGNACREEWDAAVADALGYDSEILIERYIPGREYRFFVAGGRTAAVLHRVPANVTGDGRRSIRTLVEEKNQNPLRGSGYTKPLEKIKLEKPEIEFLRSRGLTPDTVPPEGETVYLRRNSNISTGGDSIDFTDSTHRGYLQIAEAAAQAVGARICGVDIIVDDISAEPDEDSYSVIECNFNPAIHIHDFPWKGKNRKLGVRILDLLGL